MIEEVPVIISAIGRGFGAATVSDTLPANNIIMPAKANVLLVKTTRSRAQIFGTLHKTAGRFLNTNRAGDNFFSGVDSSLRQVGLNIFPF